MIGLSICRTAAQGRLDSDNDGVLSVVFRTTALSVNV